MTIKEPPKVSQIIKSPPRAIRREFYSSKDFEKALIETESVGKAVEIKVSDIYPSPYQTRSLRQDHFSELKANIAEKGLITPVLVRTREAGGYEYIAGHHRGLAFKELGKEFIPAIIVQLADEKASAAVFYDNLHGSDLQDYEKFLGLNQRQIDANLKQVELAKESGLSVTQVTKLLSYKKLPAECHILLSKNPSAVGSNTAESLAKYFANGNDSLVINAIKLIISGELKQSAAITWIDSKLKPVIKEFKKTEPIKIHGADKRVFCRIQQADKSLRLSFNSYEDAADLVRSIENIVRDYLSKTKKP